MFLFLSPLQLYDLSSPNLAQIVGIIIDTNIVYILREDYPMGSLHQVLHDPTKKLDSSFQYSFALDVIKVCVCVYVCVCVCMCKAEGRTVALHTSTVQGVDAIHSCFLGSHGNLTSTECYVDNHWVVRVSGMGLALLKSNQYCFREPSGEGGRGRHLGWAGQESGVGGAGV